MLAEVFAKKIELFPYVEVEIVMLDGIIYTLLDVLPIVILLVEVITPALKLIALILFGNIDVFIVELPTVIDWNVLLFTTTELATTVGAVTAEVVMTTLVAVLPTEIVFAVKVPIICALPTAGGESVVTAKLDIA